MIDLTDITGFKFCDVLLQCVNPDPCPLCAPEHHDHCKMLVRGRAYRAIGEAPMVGSNEMGWYIPALGGGIQDFTFRGVEFEGVYLWCRLHFVPLNEEQDEEILKRIVGCKNTVTEPA